MCGQCVGIYRADFFQVRASSERSVKRCFVGCGMPAVVLVVVVRVAVPQGVYEMDSWLLSVVNPCAWVF